MGRDLGHDWEHEEATGPGKHRSGPGSNDDPFAGRAIGHDDLTLDVAQRGWRRDFDGEIDLKVLQPRVHAGLDLEVTGIGLGLDHEAPDRHSREGVAALSIRRSDGHGLGAGRDVVRHHGPDREFRPVHSDRPDGAVSSRSAVEDGHVDHGWHIRPVDTPGRRADSVPFSDSDGHGPDGDAGDRVPAQGIRNRGGSDLRLGLRQHGYPGAGHGLVLVVPDRSRHRTGGEHDEVRHDRLTGGAHVERLRPSRARGGINGEELERIAAQVLSDVAKFERAVLIGERGREPCGRNRI